ncbi:MAG: hypothetical protein RIS54_1261 [Verrucomicrobiota bacterium]
MRNFLSSMLGALAAMVIFAVGAGALFVVLLVAISAMGEKPVAVESGSYLVVDLSANFQDGPSEIDLVSLAGERSETIQVHTATRALRFAANDSRIKGMLITGSVMPEGYGSGYAALGELRQALADFKASGKPVQAWLDNATTRDFFVASVADDLALDPFGVIFMPGLASESPFFAKALARFGVGVQVTRVGKFKSAVEPFLRDDFSAENREQLQKLLKDLWGSLKSDIASARGLEVPALQAMVDGEGLITADSALAHKLVDRLAYKDVVLDELKEATGRKGSVLPFKQIALPNYAAMVPVGEGDRVAVVYAEGEIVFGEGEWGQVGGDRFSRQLRALRLDSGVKAIVLRVNSPGGSAQASEAIQREVILAAKEKPVVVSMGSYAASGGYWISTFGQKIYAEPTTITGSIGVFGVLFNIQDLAANWGVHFDRVKTGEFADALSMSRPKTETELAIVQKSVDWIYDQFITKVATSRELDEAFVREIAQGRVWSGVEAKALGLVDEIGGLDAAIAYAVEQAGLGENYRVSEFPRTKPLSEAIAEMLHRLKPPGSARAGAATQVMRTVERQLQQLNTYNDPRGVYARLPVNLDLN